jgi:hypothetical protein
MNRIQERHGSNGALPVVYPVFPVHPVCLASRKHCGPNQFPIRGIRVFRGSFLSGCGWGRCVGCVFFRQFFLFFFYLHLPSAAFSSLHLPSLVKVPKGDLEGVLAVPPARPGPAGAG